MGEGQLRLDDVHIDVLNALDSGLERAVEADDDATFRTALVELVETVRSLGEPLTDDELFESDAILPSADAHVEEVRAMLGATDDGLIPG